MDVASSCWLSSAADWPGQVSSQVITGVSARPSASTPTKLCQKVSVATAPQEAIEHCARGLSVWHWASHEDHIEPAIVLACAGDAMTRETVAAAGWLRQQIPERRCAWCMSST